jgi:nitroreductase
MNDIIRHLEWRYATKEFDTTKVVSEDAFNTILESARLAPSSYGLQPWKFVVVKNPDIRAKLKAAAWNQGQITDASHLVVLCRRSDIDESYVTSYVAQTAALRSIGVEVLDGYKNMMVGSINGKNKDERATWMAKQVYIALGFMLHTAAQLEVDTCPMEGFDAKQFDEILGLEAKGLNSVLVCAIGYRKDTDMMAQAAKSRFSKEEVIEVI